MYDSEREATAFHEAGHVVMGLILGRIPISADIVRDENGNAGHTHFCNDDIPANYERYFDSSPEKRRYLSIRVLISLAGTAAQDLKTPGRVHDIGDEWDELAAQELIRDSMSWNDDRATYLHDRKIEAARKLVEHWSKVELIAFNLMRQNEISEGEIKTLAYI